MVRLVFDGRAVEVDAVVIAGWTGRDRAALDRHIEELAAVGVEPPSHTPMFYRVAASLLTQDESVQVLGNHTTGEVEPVLVGTPDRLWLTAGSDHTDRRAAGYGVAVAKQLCPKVLARSAWRFEEVERHWDELVLRSFLQEAGRRVPYQSGSLGELRPARELIASWQGGDARLPAGTVLFCGTIPASGRVRAATRFEFELEDPVLRRKLAGAYDVQALPIES